MKGLGVQLWFRYISKIFEAHLNLLDFQNLPVQTRLLLLNKKQCNYTGASDDESIKCKPAAAFTTLLPIPAQRCAGARAVL